MSSIENLQLQSNEQLINIIWSFQLKIFDLIPGQIWSKYGHKLNWYTCFLLGIGTKQNINRPDWPGL